MDNSHRATAPRLQSPVSCARLRVWRRRHDHLLLRGANTGGVASAVSCCHFVHLRPVRLAVCWALPTSLSIRPASQDRKVRLWNRETGAEERTIEGHSGLVACVEVAPSVLGNQERPRMVTCSHVRARVSRCMQQHAQSQIASCAITL